VSTEQIRKDSCWNELAAHIGCNIKKNDSHQTNPADHQKKLIGKKNTSLRLLTCPRDPQVVTVSKENLICIKKTSYECALM
jgi:hypothetical protein